MGDTSQLNVTVGISQPNYDGKTVNFGALDHTVYFDVSDTVPESFSAPRIQEGVGG